MTAVPSDQAPLVDSGGRATPSWMRFFTALVGQREAIAAVPVPSSPFQFTAAANGTLAIVGGIISAITLTRGRVTIALMAAPGLIPVGNKDVVTITYSQRPTVSFIPS